MKKKVLKIVALQLLFLSLSAIYVYAEDSSKVNAAVAQPVQNTAEIQTKIADLSQKIAANPKDKNSWNARGQLYDKIGDHQAAVNDLRQNCSLEPDPDVKELCDLEVTEYIKTYSVK